MARKLALGEIAVNDEQFTYIDLRIRTQILELAYDYAAYLVAVKKKKRPHLDLGVAGNQEERQQILHQLLTTRSQLAIESQQPYIAIPSYRPDQGHSGHRIGIRYGYEQPLQFLQLDFRWAYHDSFDPSSGYIKGAQLEFFKPAVR